MLVAMDIRRSGARASVCLSACAAMVLLGVGARAEIKPADAAAARALFDEARALVAQSKVEEACPKFQESQRLDPGMGTLFNLADCNERVGRTATAWTMFLDVARQAKVAGQPEKEEAAQKRAEILLPKLSKLSVVVPADSDISGLQVMRDGSVLGRPLWGTPAAADPGKHVIVATATGRRRWVSTVDVKADASTTTATVPLLVESSSTDAPEPPLPLTVANSATSDSGAVPQTGEPLSKDGSNSSQAAIGLVVSGVGVVGVGVGAYFMVKSNSNLDDSKASCQDNTCFTRSGYDLYKEAQNARTTSLIVGGIGLAALVGGAVVFFTAPSKSNAPKQGSAASQTAIGFTPGGLIFRGTF
jgi:serine/threonine-protein kinase